MELKKLAILALGALLTLSVKTGSAQIVTNGSFETPVLSPFTIQYLASIPGWTMYGGGEGLCTVGGVTLTPSGQDGNQFAFLQSSSASMSQTLSLPVNQTGSYTLTYFVAGRHDGGSYKGNVTYSVLLDATTIIANARTVSDQPFTLETVSFKASPGSHVLTFTNAPVQIDDDDMAFFDAVQIVNGAPPPNLMTNGSFELPLVPTDNYEYSTNAGFDGSGWNYSANGSGVIFSPAFFSENAEDGSQIAFLQDASAAVWQTVVLPADGTYNLTYYYAGRIRPPLEYYGGEVTGTVSFDSTMLATNITHSADNSTEPFNVNSITFTASAGAHILMFSNSPAVESDNTMFIDNVQLVQVAPMTVARYAQLQVHGSIGTNYTVEYADALPATSWTPLGNLIPTNDPSFFVDVTNAGILRQRFYQCPAATAPGQSATLGLNLYTGYNVQGTVGANYLIQSLDPSLSTGWTPIASITASTSPYLWLDLNSKGQPKNIYYRAALVP